MLNEQQRSKAETMAVELILAVRRAYCRSVNGKVTPKYWTLLQKRLLSSAEKTFSVSQMVTLVLEKMQLQNLNNSDSDFLIELISYCREQKLEREFLAFIRSEYPFLMAIARRTVEQKREERELEAAEGLSISKDDLLAAAEDNGILAEDCAL